MEDEILNKNFDDDSETENYSLNESSDVSTDEECDSILTTVQMSSSNCFIGKNGYKWNKNHAIIGRTRSHNIITHLPGLKGPAKPKPNCSIDIFNLFFTAAIIKQISEFTNAKIEEFRQRISDLTKSTYSNFTSEIEIRAFLGLLYLAGVYKSGHENVESLFASDGTGRDIFRSVMSVKRFLFLLLCIRFDNFKTRCKVDRLSPIRDIFQTIIEKFQSCYTPAEYLTVDEMLVGFRGKCPFKIYIPSKPNKYGIKIVILADSRTHYMYNAMVYTGKSKTPKSKELSLPTQIVLDISRPLWKSNRNITADNWFTSIELVDKLKEHGLTYLGTMRKNKPQIPPQFQPHPKRESGTSIFGFSGTKTLVFYVPKKRKSVILISSMHHDNKCDKTTGKPDIIMDYNLTKGSVDTIDQMVSNFSTSCRSRRWPLALFYALLDITALNSYIIFNYQIDKKDQKERSTFIVDLGRSLIDEHLATRNLNSLPLELQTTIKKFKNNDGSSTSRGSTMPQESDTPKRCYKCPSKNAGKVKTLCSTEPLHRLLNKRNCWKWKEVEDRAFREAKNLIQSDLVLTPYDARKPLVLACDASPFGVGAVLSHVEEGMERPIAFASRTMSQTERRYAQIDKEALAIIFGISKFYKYLYGRDFKIITDHKPLLGIFNPNKPIPQMLSLRMMRWSLTLASYSYQIEHRSGRMNANADALSRAPHEKTSKETPEPVDVFLMETNEESPLEAKEVAKLTQEDSVLGIIVEWTRIGWPAHCPAEKFRPYFNRRNELSLHRECLLWGNGVVIPPVLQRRTIEQLHETHPGIVQMKAIARSHVWWPGMDKAIENRVERCENCQLVRNNPKPSPVHPWTAPVKPWSRIHIDYAGPFHGRTFLIVVDSMSKWPEAIIMDHCTATATVRVLRNLFAVHGLPDQVVSDNGRMFVGHEFQEFLRMNGIRHITSAPYHPQTNGQAERVVQTLKQLIRKNGWEIISVTLPRALFAMRTTPHGTTGLTPAELLMGRRLTTRMNRLHPKESEDSENGKEHFQNRFKSQENVYARKYNGKGKWEPGKIKTVLGPRNYEVIMENGVTAKRHQDQLMRRVKEEVSEDVEKKEECNTERRGEQMNDPNESPERLEETPGPSRPIRNRRLPEYLKDCVTNWG
ncbi:K02A2.6-like [Cordylochernes scorpioides]|uniref:RNA-directed DNA polymerase n=1 Tax=Cordylochernes scorpioides TaxID=51811 RepID=A0ABY6L4C1_9ARAC|nr:K02A2.6-like [Cordylochernes scorpioides]